MKIYPINSVPKTDFRAKLPMPAKQPSNTKQFFEAASIVGLTSVPMFVYLYLYWLYQKVFGHKQTKE